MSSQAGGHSTLNVTDTNTVITRGSVVSEIDIVTFIETKLQIQFITRVVFVLKIKTVLTHLNILSLHCLGFELSSVPKHH